MPESRPLDNLSSRISVVGAAAFPDENRRLILWVCEWYLPAGANAQQIAADCLCRAKGERRHFASDASFAIWLIGFTIGECLRSRGIEDDSPWPFDD